MKQRRVEVTSILTGPLESFENTVKALETAIRVIKKVESEMASKPPCYTSLIPYLKSVRDFFQYICKN